MKIVRMIATLAAAALMAGTAPTSAKGPARPLSTAAKVNWNARTAVTPSGSHTVGNPDAAVKLVEYVSYTCPHCAHFEAEADTPMRVAYVSQGKLQIEVRHLVRDPIDMTVALLTNCGNPSRFYLNHAAFMRSQSTWIQPMATATTAQRQRWTSGDNLARLRAIASDFRFYDIMATRGYARTDVDRCLADQAMARKLVAMTEGAAELGVNSTPSFVVNGVLLAGTHDWEMLQPQLAARM